MKIFLYFAIVIVATSCTSSRNFAVEDDIYYFPGKKSLTITEVEKITGQEINSFTPTDSYSEETSRSKGSNIAPLDFQKSKQKLISTSSNELETVDMNAIAQQAKNQLAQHENVNETLYQNTGYWIGGYKGNENDLQEIQQIINQYPNGFAFFSGNGTDIAMNLSFDSDWNVYTDNGYYWWFPSSSNMELYSSLLFGTYPKQIWTIAWDNPSFDSWAFDSHFNNNVNWNINIGWGSPGWNFGFGWNSGYYHGYNHGWYDPWCDPWHRPYYGYNSCWNRPHWNNPHWNRPHWNDNHYPIYPSRPVPIKPGGSRPGVGNTISGVRPGSSSRPGVSGNRPGSVTRPNTSTRPNNMTRPGTSTTRPGSSVRPGSTTRPGNTTRPGSVTRPNTSTRPSTTTRPGTVTRPSSTTRPNTSTRPSNVTRPSTRPNSSTRPSTSTRSSVNRSSSHSSRPQNNYVPTQSRSSSSSSRSSSMGSSNSGSSGRSSTVPTRNNSGGSRRR